MTPVSTTFTSQNELNSLLPIDYVINNAHEMRFSMFVFSANIAERTLITKTIICYDLQAFVAAKVKSIITVNFNANVNSAI